MKPKEVSSQPVAVYVPIELEPSQFEEGQKSELELRDSSPRERPTLLNGDQKLPL